MSAASGGPRSYVAVVAGTELAITDEVEQRLEDGPVGMVNDADLVVVDGPEQRVWRRESSDGQLRRDTSYNVRQSGERTAIFALLCIYAREPNRDFSNAQLTGMVEAALGTEGINIADNIRRLDDKPKSVPLKRGRGQSRLLEGTKVIMVEDRTEPESVANQSA